MEIDYKKSWDTLKTESGGRWCQPHPLSNELLTIGELMRNMERRASESAELAATVPAGAAANTASPKYPQIEEIFKELSFLAYGPLNGRETNLVLSTVNFIERKLWA